MCNKDLFSTLSFFYFLSSCFAVTYFSIKGPEKNRKLLITTRDRIIFFTHFFFILIMFILVTSVRVIFNVTFELENIPEFCVVCSYFIFLCGLFISEIKNRKLLIFIYTKLLQLEKLFVKYKFEFEIKNLRKYVILFIVTQTLLLNYIILDFLMYYPNFSFIFYFIAEIMSILSTTHLWILLYLIYQLTKKLNDIILKVNSVSLNHFKISFNYLLNIHSDLFVLSKQINRFFDFLITRIFIFFFALVYTVFKATLYLLGTKLELMWSLDTIFWNVFNTFQVLMIIFMHTYVEREVSLAKKQELHRRYNLL